MVSSMSKIEGIAASQNRRFLVRGASVLTMDPKLGEIDRTDVLVENGIIAAIGASEVGDAEVIDAQGMILMPGMVDGHRHLWQDMAKNYRFRNFMFDTNVRFGPMFSADDFYLANLVGGLTALDSGVTTVVDFCHLVQDYEQAHEAARGTRDSNVTGFFCPQLLPKRRTYGPGASIPAEEAWVQTMAPAAPDLVRDLERVRDELFSVAADPLRFGLCLTGPELSPRKPEEVLIEFEYARRLEACLVTQHLLGTSGAFRMGLDRNYRVVPELIRHKLIGPGYLAAHGTGLSNDELAMIADAGGAIVSTVMGEVGYADPPAHARFRLAGGSVAIGADGTGRDTHDYFQHIRAAKHSLFRDEANFMLGHTLTPDDYLGLATIEGARAIGLDGVIGSISVGKRADLVLLRTDRAFFPRIGTLASKVFGYSSIEDVDSVWVSGRRVKANGRLIGADWEDLFARCNAAWERIERDALSISFTGKMGPTFPSKSS